MLREIKGTKRLSRVLLFRVTGTGTAAINEGAYDATLTDNGTGDYTLTFDTPFARTPVCVVGVLTANIIHQISSVSASAVRVKLFQGTDGTTATDGIFHLVVYGFDAVAETD
jgi:hypothetical protein